MATNYSRWYRIGTVNVTKGSKIVTGTETFWLAASLHSGDIFSIDSTKSYEIDTVTDNTHITLKTAYAEATASGKEYEIVRNFTANLPAEVASQTSELIYDVRRYIDTEMLSITGKSAYEVAVKNGYVGTEAQWLRSLVGLSAYETACNNGYTGTEAQWLRSLVGLSAYETACNNGYTGTEAEWLSSLIGAGQWDVLNARTDILTAPAWLLKNQIPTCRCLGTAPTEEQLAHIADGSFEGIGLGDYWKDAKGVRWRIHAFNYYATAYAPHSRPDPLTGETRAANWYTAGRRGANTGEATKDGLSLPHHVIVIPDSHIIDSDGTNLTTDYYIHPDAVDTAMTDGYFGSYWYTTVRPKVLARVAEIFGDEHLLEWTEYFLTSYSAGGGIGYTQTFGRLELMLMSQINGHQWLWYQPDGTLRLARGEWWDQVGSDQPQFDLCRVGGYKFWPQCATRTCVVWSDGKLAMERSYNYIRKGNSITSNFWTQEGGYKMVLIPYFCLG